MKNSVKRLLTLFLALLLCAGLLPTATAASPDAGSTPITAAESSKAKPAAPHVKIALNEKGKPALSWKAVSGAAKYQVFRSTTGEKGSFRRVATVTGTSYVNGKAAAGTTYYYKVRALTAEGAKGAFSAVVKKTAVPTAPRVKIALNEKGKPSLSWKAVSGAAKYQIWRSTTGEKGSFRRVATVTGTSYVNKKASAGTTYYYKVRALTAEGAKGAFSTVVKKTAVPTAPRVKTALSEEGKPSLSWKAVSGAAKYQIWRSTTGESGSFRRIATVTGTNYVNKKAAADTTYYYKVRAVTEAGAKGVFSAVVSCTATTPTPVEPEPCDHLWDGESPYMWGGETLWHLRCERCGEEYFVDDEGLEDEYLKRKIAYKDPFVVEAQRILDRGLGEYETMEACAAYTASFCTYSNCCWADADNLDSMLRYCGFSAKILDIRDWLDRNGRTAEEFYDEDGEWTWPAGLGSAHAWNYCALSDGTWYELDTSYGFGTYYISEPNKYLY